jgi:DNA-directed RNA polymerase subunit RPC12/RpoP
MYRLEQDSCALLFGGARLEPVALEENMVGFCSRCDEELHSISYYQFKEEWLVAARCVDCSSLILMRYDKSWTWLEDSDLEEVSKSAGISSLPREQLEAVFSAAELKAMEAREKGEPYLRQNLYRARAKYEKFEKLFGARIDL